MVPDAGNGGSFLRFAFINMLLDIVYRSQDPRVILDGLRVVCQDEFSDRPEEVMKYKERMYEETLTLITKGVFSLSQVCEAVVILSRFYPHDKPRSLEMADRLWTGILEKTSKEELSSKTVVSVFRTLPCLTQSRDMVYKIIANRACEMWTELSTTEILEILRAINIMGSVQCSYCQNITLSMISQWASVNVHKLSERELLALVVCFDRMDFIDANFVRTLEKYMKLRGVQIKEADLVAATCDYCDHQKLRSLPILEAAAEYLVANKNFNTPQINSIAKVFGSLNLHPATGFKFWEKVELLLEQKFAEFPPKDLVHLMLSFVQIAKFPVNMAHKIFNPNFYDRLESCHSAQDRYNTIAEMDLLLASLRLETIFHKPGGYLKRTETKTENRFRMHRTAKEMLYPLGLIVGDVQRIDVDVLIPGMCFNSLYRADMMIYPASVTNSLLKLASSKDKNSCVAVLVRVPEHYDRDQKHLLGREAMRERQLKKMGYKVMNVDHSTVLKLLVMPQNLKEYLQAQYDLALKDQ